MEKYIEYTQDYRIDISQDDVHYTADGAVYKGIDAENGRIMACKLINTTDDYKFALEQVKHEMSVLRRLEREYINTPRLYGIKEEKENHKIWLFMEWIEGKTLEEKMKESIPPGKFLLYMSQLSEIIMVMEKCKIAHKDIKPSNIIVNQNSITMQERVFLIDFDISLNISVRGEGTDDYRAPEMWNSSSDVRREKADLFSIGVIMYEYYTGTVPKRGIDYIPNPLGRKEWKTYIHPKEKKEEIDDNIDELITRLMQFNPDERLRNASELRNRIKKLKQRGFR